MKTYSEIASITLCLISVLCFTGCNTKPKLNHQDTSITEKLSVKNKTIESFKKLSNPYKNDSKVSWYLIDKGLDNTELFKVSIKILSKDRTPRIYLVNDEKMFEEASKLLKKESEGIDGMPHEYMQRYIVVYIDKSADGKHIVFSGRSLYASHKLVLGTI